MALAAVKAYPMVASNQIGDATSNTVHYNFAKTSAVGYAMLSTINHTDAQNSFAADAHVFQYIQNDATVDGNWPRVWITNCTGMSFIMTVNGCLARAVAVTLLYG